MIMIILVGTVSQIRMGDVCITFTGMGSRGGKYAILMSKFGFLMHVCLFIIILGYSASYFLAISDHAF